MNTELNFDDVKIDLVERVKWLHMSAACSVSVPCDDVSSWVNHVKANNADFAEHHLIGIYC